MGNHVHLLLHEQKAEIAIIMKRIGISYAWWYNREYNRVGYIFQDHKSETVVDDKYLLSLLRYIHNNPVKAQMGSIYRDTTKDTKWTTNNCTANDG